MSSHDYYQSRQPTYNWSNGIIREIYNHSFKEWLTMIAYSIYLPMLIGNITLNIRDQYLTGIHLSTDSFFYIIGYICSAAFLFATISELSKRYILGLILILGYFYYLFIGEALKIDSVFISTYLYIFCLPSLILAIISLKWSFKKSCNDAVHSMNYNSNMEIKDKNSRLSTVKLLLSHIDFDEDKLGKLLNFSKTENDKDVMMLVVNKFREKSPNCSHGIANHFVKTEGMDTYYYLKDNGYFYQNNTVNMFRLFNLFIDLYDDKQEDLAKTIYKDISNEHPNFAIDVENLITIWTENGKLNYNCEVMQLISKMPYHEKLKTVMRYLIMNENLEIKDSVKQPKKIKI